MFYACLWKKGQGSCLHAQRGRGHDGTKYAFPPTVLLSAVSTSFIMVVCIMLESVGTANAFCNQAKAERHEVCSFFQIAMHKAESGLPVWLAFAMLRKLRTASIHSERPVSHLADAADTRVCG